MRCELLAGADLIVSDCYSATALHHAALRGDAEIVRSVLEHMAIQADADLNAVDHDGETALMVALDQILDSRRYTIDVINRKVVQTGAEFVMVCIALIEAG